MGNQWKKRSGIVYSTDDRFEFRQIEAEEEETLEPSKQMLYISIDRKQRKGKIVTIVSNFIGKSTDLQSLAKELKKRCGVGGSVKDGEILIQGEKRDLIIAYLSNEGYKTKVKGG
jgi:translation initiation factor 1